MERWNIDFQTEIGHFIFNSAITQHCTILCEPEAKTHYSIFPIFHHSPAESGMSETN